MDGCQQCLVTGITATSTRKFARAWLQSSSCEEFAAVVPADVGSPISHVIVAAINSGVARTSPLLGHSVGTLRLYELPREVQKLIGGSGGHPPTGILQPPRSVLRPCTVAKCKSLTANSRV